MFNLCKKKIITADGIPVPLRDDLNSRQLEQSDFLPGYTPYGRQKKTRDQQSNNKNQSGDNEQSSISLGPGAGTDNINGDNDRGEDARKQFDQWFGGHEYLWERQTGMGGHDSGDFMTGGDGYGEPAVDGGASDQAESPIGAAAKVRRQTDPAGNRDNMTPKLRLPGASGQIAAPRATTQKERDRSLFGGKPVKAFNQSRRKEYMTPLYLTWAHLKKGSAD